MHTVPHRSLPLATTSAITARVHQPRDRMQGWARALADAAHSAQPGIDRPAASAAAPGARVLAAAPVAWPGAGVLRSADESWLGATASVRSAGLQWRAGAESTHVAPQPAPSVSGMPPARAAARHCGRAPWDGQPAAPAAAMRPRALQPSAASAIHMHVEHRDGGVAVWLGASRSLPAETLHALVAALRTPGRSGPCVVAVTCNGTAVFSRYPAPKESP